MKLGIISINLRTLVFTMIGNKNIRPGQIIIQVQTQIEVKFILCPHRENSS